MHSIDEIMDMLDCSNTEDVQAQGRKLAKDIRCVNVFIQPLHEGHIENVWANCARIISERSDKEIDTYLYDLFEWLMNMNWPGASCIYNRLLKYKDTERLERILDYCIDDAKSLGKEDWYNTLKVFKKEYSTMPRNRNTLEL